MQMAEGTLSYRMGNAYENHTLTNSSGSMFLCRTTYLSLLRLCSLAMLAQYFLHNTLSYLKLQIEYLQPSVGPMHFLLLNILLLFGRCGTAHCTSYSHPCAAISHTARLAL